MSTDPIQELLAIQDADIDEAQEHLSDLNDQVVAAKRTLAELIDQRTALEQIAIRKGLDVRPSDPTPEEDENWVSLSRVDAIERALRDFDGPMHLTKIAAILQAHGRKDDSTEAISATLAHIRKSRRTVASLGNGRWEYIRAGTNTGGARQDEDLAVILAGGIHPEVGDQAGRSLLEIGDQIMRGQ